MVRETRKKPCRVFTIPRKTEGTRQEGDARSPHQGAPEVAGPDKELAALGCSRKKAR
jgi:hypothetical protein